MGGFDRRGFIKAAGVMLAAGATGAPPLETAGASMFGANVDETLFRGINRVILGFRHCYIVIAVIVDVVFCENGRYKIFGEVINDPESHAWLSFKNAFISLG